MLLTIGFVVARGDTTPSSQPDERESVLSEICDLVRSRAELGILTQKDLACARIDLLEYRKTRTLSTSELIALQEGIIKEYKDILDKCSNQETIGTGDRLAYLRAKDNWLAAKNVLKVMPR